MARCITFVLCKTQPKYYFCKGKYWIVPDKLDDLLRKHKSFILGMLVDLQLQLWQQEANLFTIMNRKVSSMMH
jgi:hypothetical protein